MAPVLIVVAWAFTLVAVLALARVLGSVSTARVAPPVDEPAPETLPDNVVPLVPRPRNALREAA